jgi:hypothetical protein
MPQPVKNRIHVLFVHGHGLTCPLSGLRQELIELGLIKTYKAGPYHANALCDLALEKFQSEPDARFVLVGHGAGCGALPDMVVRLQAQGMPVALVVCIEGRQYGQPEAPCVTAVSTCEARDALLGGLHEVAQQIGIVDAVRGPAPFPADEWGFLNCGAPPAPRCLPIPEAAKASPGPTG